jgi:hypothetical protein
MRLKYFLTGVSLLSVCFFILPQSVYANGKGRHGHERSSYHDYYRHYRYYPKEYYFHNRIYFYPRRRYYFYYEVYPEKRYYHQGERDTAVANPNYLPLTSIVHMASQGVPDAVIIEEIKRTRSVYKLNSEIITYLKQNSVSDEVIDFMMQTEGKY